MKISYKVWAVILLSIAVTVTGRPQENQPINNDEEKELSSQPERDSRSFSSVPREGGEAIENHEEEDTVKLDETGVYDVTTKFVSKNITKNNEKLRNNEEDYEEISTDKKVKFIPQVNHFFDNYKNDEANENINNKYTAKLYFRDRKGNYILGNQPIEHRNIEENYEAKTNENDNFFNGLIKNNYGTYIKPSIPYNNYYTSQPPINYFNPNLKDVFKYNPVFDYIKKNDKRYQNNDYDDDDVDEDEDEDNYDKKPFQKSQIKRKIQYYQTIFQPNPNYLFNQYNNMEYFLNNQQELIKQQNQNYIKPITITTQTNNNKLQQNSENVEFGQRIKNNDENNLDSNMKYSGSQISNQNTNNDNYINNNIIQKAWDDYFPIVIQNPFNTMWSAFTNIVEYGPAADVCNKKKNKKNKRRGRNILKDDADYSEDLDYSNSNDGMDVTTEFVIDDFSRSTEKMPYIRRLKVRRGGVAIAGPGGIATAGSGGTAIVGPGGTAYTKKDGTAIVGPGGRLVHVPEFLSFPFFKQAGNDARGFEDPPGSKFIAMGPLIYSNPSLDNSE